VTTLPTAPANSGYATDPHGWAEMLSTRPARQPLNGDHRADWVVVGAGVTGLACARRLAELHPDKEVFLLDARQVGQGASGRNSGFAVGVSHFSGGFQAEQAGNYRRTNRINQAGVDLLRAQVSDHAIDCQWYEGGFHHTAADQSSVLECENFLRYLEALEIPHTPLDRDELQGRLGTGLYQSGVHVPQGALLQPAALVRGLADSLPENVTLTELSPVVSIENGEPLVLRLVDGAVRADNLVLATNYEAAKLGYLRRYLLGVTLSGSFTRTLSDSELASLGDLGEWGVLSLHSGGATVRLTADRRICLRNTAEYHGSALLSDRQLARRQEIHRAGFEKRFPQLAHVPFEYAWSGVEGVSCRLCQRWPVTFDRRLSRLGARGVDSATALPRYRRFPDRTVALQGRRTGSLRWCRTRGDFRRTCHRQRGVLTRVHMPNILNYNTNRIAPDS
jgi:glycine/D-amino acid oxidase-like deaminating enzyme